MSGEVLSPPPGEAGEGPEQGPSEEDIFEDNVLKTMALLSNPEELQNILEAKRAIARGEIRFPKPEEWPADLDWDRIQQEHADYEVRTMEEALRRLQG